MLRCWRVESDTRRSWLIYQIVQIYHQKALLMHSLAHNYSTVEFPSFISNAEVNNHRYVLRNDTDFFVPRANLAFVSRLPFIDFPSTWNSLDSSLKEISNRSNFKSLLKLELLDKYENFRCNKTICVSCMSL